MITIFLIAVTGFEYMLVDPVAQRVGMGYALAADGYSVNYNPAGLAYDTCGFYSASYLNYIGGTHFGYLGLERNQLGLGARYFYSGSMKKTDSQGNEYGTFGTHFIDLTFGKGLFIQDVGLGFSLKLIYENIDSLYCIGAGADLGGLYYFPDYDLQVGLALKNVGTTLKPFITEREALPYELDLSAVKRFTSGWIGLDLVKPAFISFGARVGGEYEINRMFCLRASYNSTLSSMRTGNNGLDFLTGVMVGFGIKVMPLNVNFSYAPYFDLGGGLRISVNIGG
jgi:hypothetical protein